jgi:hypothetical protein
MELQKLAGENGFLPDSWLSTCDLGLRQSLITLTLNTSTFWSYTAALDVVDLSASALKALDGVRTAHRGGDSYHNSEVVSP